MKIQDFEKELQLIDKDLAIRPNNPPERVLKAFPDLDKLASITYRGSELCTIPNFDIYDEPNGSYGVDLRNDGRFIAHKTRPQALSEIKDKLARLQTDKEYYQDFFGLGASSDASLRSKDAPGQELVEEVPIELKPVEGGMIEGPNEM